MSLPESWVEVRLDAVCLLNPRLASDELPDDETEVTFVPMSAVDEGVGVVAKPEVRTFGEVSKGYTSFKNRDVLFAKVTPCMENGKAAIAGSLLNGLGFGSTEFHVLRPTDVVLPEYLFHFIRQPVFRAYAASAFVGTGGLQRVPPDFLERVKLPLPTLPEQQRIVEVLRQAETLANPQQSRDRQLDLMIKAYLDRLVLAIDESEWVQLNNLVETRYGTSVSADVVADFGSPVLRIPNVMGGEVDTADMKYVELSPIEVERLRLTISDVLIVRSNGNPDYVGRSAPITVDIEKAGMVYASYLIRLRADTGRLLPEYLSSFLNSAFGRAAMRHAIRTTAGQSNLSGENLTKIRVPLPAISEQKKFAAFWQEVRLLRQFMSQSGRIAKQLRAELAIFALSGELTSEWRITHQQVIAAATAERDKALRERGTKVSVHIEVSAPPERRPLQGRTTRHAVLNELSEFQEFVFDALREWKGTLLADDMTVLDEFCRLWPIEHERNMHDRVRRSLEQLAGLGLIAKVALPNDRGDFVIGYRMLRPEEETRSRDIARLQQLLRTASGKPEAQS